MKVLALLSLTSAVLASPLVHTGQVDKDAAPLLSSTSASDKIIPDSYMIVFKDHVSETAASEHHSWVASVHDDHCRELKKRSLQVPLLDKARELLDSKISRLSGLKHVYSIADSFRGYSGSFDEKTIDAIRRHPDVLHVEHDSIVHHQQETETNAPWGLARISHREALGFGSFNKYLYSEHAGTGVDVYVIDTGTNINHVDFEGRAKWGKTIPEGDADEDGNGHGTHCSGTVAGKLYGVAKNATIIAVKVLRSNGSGTMADVVKGVEYAAQSHVKKIKSMTAAEKKKFKGSAANMSLGGGKSTTLNIGVNAAVKAGIHFAVAAGNDNADACSYSPAGAELPVTVGASTLTDERAYFSNFGKCTDIFAPGLNIKSTWIGSKYATNVISGTSMASPHIAGLLAYYLSLQPDVDSQYYTGELTPEKLKAYIIKEATPNVLSDIPKDTPNLLAWNGGGLPVNISSVFFERPSENKVDLSAKIKADVEQLIHDIKETVEADVDGLLEKARQALHQ